MEIINSENAGLVILKALSKLGCQAPPDIHIHPRASMPHIPATAGCNQPVARGPSDASLSAESRQHCLSTFFCTVGGDNCPSQGPPHPFSLQSG